MDLVQEGENSDQEQEQTSNQEDGGENERQVSREDAQAYAEEAGLLFFETSAKSAENVDAVFTDIGNIMIYNWYCYVY